MDAESLIRVYPWLDHLMAETLLKLSEQGKLEGHLKRWPEPLPGPTSQVVAGAITVEPPPEKSPMPG